MPAPDRLSLTSRSGIPSGPWLRPEQDRTSPMPSEVTILLVDDDERGRRLTSRMLRDEGYVVIEAQSGEQALERLAKADQVHIVLTDIAMPGGMSGVELAEKVDLIEPWRRVILMSGYDRLFPKWGESAARFPLLMKPFTAEQLLRQMRDVLKGGMH